jgi:hypothetical protein
MHLDYDYFIFSTILIVQILKTSLVIHATRSAFIISVWRLVLFTIGFWRLVARLTLGLWLLVARLTIGVWLLVFRLTIWVWLLVFRLTRWVLRLVVRLAQEVWRLVAWLALIRLLLIIGNWQTHLTLITRSHLAHNKVSIWGHLHRRDLFWHLISLHLEVRLVRIVIDDFGISHRWGNWRFIYSSELLNSTLILAFWSP